MFKEAKIGDKVFDYLKQQWGIIEGITPSYKDRYPLKVRFKDNSFKTFTEEGKLSYSIVQTLFWNEVKPITPPKKPLPNLKKDTKVLVWEYGDVKRKRYFSHFSNTGLIYCFEKGKTSWTTTNTIAWENWELADDS